MQGSGQVFNHTSGETVSVTEMAKGSLSETVSREILSLIQSNRLQTGAVLPSENQLSEKLGISRGIVREAVRGLANLGIVEVGMDAVRVSGSSMVMCWRF